MVHAVKKRDTFSYMHSMFSIDLLDVITSKKEKQFIWNIRH
jgi:hypothetical protein